MRELNEIFHAGELEAQQKFNEKRSWSKQAIAGLNQMFKEAIDDETAYTIEGFKFFFIATSNNTGECDCSYRGTEEDNTGRLLPAVHVIDSKTLIFPDYSGNMIYNSLGNIIDNPHIGMLFINFETALRIRVNGSARIIEDKSVYHHIWPQALRYIEVKVQQVYFNCQKRIRK